jgi:hypothetical protein
MSTGWSLVEIVSKSLDANEREAVLGDLLEANESAARALLEVFELLLRRQGELWCESRAWVAGLTVSLPSSYLLMNVSVSVSYTFRRLIFHEVFNGWWPTGNEGFLLLFYHMFLLLAWAWAAGYVVGYLSPKTVWLSAVLCFAPTLLCLESYPLVSLGIANLFWFVLPGAVGVYHGARKLRISPEFASVLVVLVVLMMISAWNSNALWVLNWALLLPLSYVVGMAWSSGYPGEAGSSWPMGRRISAGTV